VIIVIILLVGGLGITLGYAVRQRQTLLENKDVMKEQGDEIKGLVRENAELQHKVTAHETSLEMVLDSIDQPTS
jgi:uncharacterized protein HemX